MKGKQYFKFVHAIVSILKDVKIRADTRGNIIFFSFVPQSWLSGYSPWSLEGPLSA
jgi:hypothetical protein